MEGGREGEIIHVNSNILTCMYPFLQGLTQTGKFTLPATISPLEGGTKGFTAGDSD